MRPWSVTLLALAVLSIAILNLVRGWQAYSQHEFLSEILPISWLYLAISGTVWGLMGVVLFLGLWFGRARAYFFTAIATLVYSAYYWIDRLWLATEREQANLPFAVGLNLIVVLLTFWILSRRKTLLFFGDLNDR